MHLPFVATRLHMRAPSHLTRHFKGRHHGGGRRGAPQSPGAQRALAGGRASVGLLGRLLRTLWQRVRSQASGQILPLPVCPPALRVMGWVVLPRAEAAALPNGARPYLLRAHAQARWRPARG